jgi:hypothetical protein
METKEVFDEIYKTNKWGNDESVSGSGSTIGATKHVIIGLNDIVKKYDINSILDIPCGDFNWMRKVNMSKVDYLGADIVEDLVQSNRTKYPDHKFKVMDLTKDQLPKVDLIFCRDCLFHLPYELINTGLENIKNSGSKYLLTTTFTDKTIPNRDIKLGQWRRLNLEIEPFSLSPPIEIFNEKTYKDKSMGLWDITHL